MSFTNDLKRFSDKSIKDVSEVKRAVSLSLFNSIIQDTPVDTGRARGNWQTDTGQAKSGVVERDDKGGEKASAEAKGVIEDSDLNDTLYMSNNLPYIEPLENGSSSQSPEGMVKRNFARIKRIIASKIPR